MKPLPADVDAWQRAHLGQPGSCPCGDPIILADTEGWKRPRCFDCWVALGEPRAEPAEA